MPLPETMATQIRWRLSTDLNKLAGSLDIHQFHIQDVNEIMGQNHDCWCSGSLRRQITTNNGNGYVGWMEPCVARSSVAMVLTLLDK